MTPRSKVLEAISDACKNLSFKQRIDFLNWMAAEAERVKEIVVFEQDHMGGLEIVHTKGYPEAVYLCSCGRMQAASHPDSADAGISVESAEAIGWCNIDGEWKCPICTGNTENLRKAFAG